MAISYVDVANNAFAFSQFVRSLKPDSDAVTLEIAQRTAVEELYYAAFHAVRAVLSEKLLVAQNIPHKALWDWIATPEAKQGFPGIGKTHTRGVRLKEWRENARYDIHEDFDKSILAAESDVRSILSIVDPQLCADLEIYRGPIEPLASG